MRPLLGTLVASAVLAAPIGAWAASSIGGQVVDRNGRPVQKAMVSLEPGGIELVTDRDGKFTIAYLRDELGERVKLERRTDYTLEIVKPGFHIQSVPFKYTHGEFVLEPVMLVAETIEVHPDDVNIDPGTGAKTEEVGVSREGY